MDGPRLPEKVIGATGNNRVQSRLCAALMLQPEFSVPSLQFRYYALVMRITVVILNWNRAHDTVEAVRSVLRQDYPDFEVLVWDNASSDDSQAVLNGSFANEPRVRLIWGQGNYGVAGGRNRAFAEATGELLFSLDNDATIETPGALTRIAEVMQCEPDIGALSFEVRRPDGHLMWPFSRPSATWREQRFDTIRVDGCSFVTPRAVFEQIGGFAEHFSPYGAEDQYYAYQVLGTGRRVVYFPEIKVIHAFSPKGRQGKQFAMHVRNMLWTPLELFPFPQNLIRAATQSLHLWRDAREQNQHAFFLAGLRDGCSNWFRRRTPLSRTSWQTIRHLVAEDKKVTAKE